MAARQPSASPSDRKPDVADTAALGSSSASAKPSVGARIGAHFKKWWWVYVILVIILVLVIVLPVVYVGYPKMAQDGVRKSTLNITAMSITNPTPGSFDLQQTQVLGSHSSLHPSIYAFSAAVSLLGGSAFGNVQVPRMKAEDAATVHIEKTVALRDRAAFGEFAKEVVAAEEVEVNVYGKPKLKLGGLPIIDVVYNKTVTMKGLNKLAGFDITEFNLLDEDAPDGTNTNGTVYIPNPTVMTIAMGNITLNLSAKNTSIGHAFLHNLTLHPGNNTIPMTSTVDKLAVVKVLSADTMLPVDIRGNSSVYEGRELGYFSEALAANVLQAKLDVGKALLGSLF